MPLVWSEYNKQEENQMSFGLFTIMIIAIEINKLNWALYSGQQRRIALS